MAEDSLLVILDVKSLCTNIPNQGINVKQAYDKYPNKTVSIKVITTFLNLILTLYNFIFNLIYKFTLNFIFNYIQNIVCAMGTGTAQKMKFSIN